MKITIKTLQNKVSYIDAEPTETIADLKSKIQTGFGHPTAVQKLIYSGRVMSDERSIDSYEVKETDFLVLMVTKPKPTPEAPPAARSPAAAAPILTERETSSPTVSRPSSSDATSAVTSSQALNVQGATKNSVAMCFESQRTSEWAPAPGSRSLGPPAPSSDGTTPVPPAPQSQNLFEAAQAYNRRTGLNTGTLNLDALASNPLLSDLLGAQQNIALLQPLLQHILTSNPQLAEDLELLNDPVPSDERDEDVTPEEQEAINRLQSLGFPRQVVIQVFIACEKNENATANMLLDSLQDEEN